MKKYFEMVIAIIFLVYGLIRLGVGSLLLGQETGIIDFEAFRDPITDISKFLQKSDDKQIIPVSVAGYVSYIALMGVVLITGAYRTFKNRAFGLSFIGVFLLMYFVLFINFQTINPKAIHLGVCFLLFLILVWLKGDLNKMAKSIV